VYLAAVTAALMAAWPRPVATQTPAAPSGSPPSAVAVFRSSTDIVALQTTVIDQQGKVVPNLRMEDFAVYEEGMRQPVTLFATATAPVDIMLLLDVSGSMNERMDAARAAAMELVHTLRPDDRGALVVFSDYVRIAQGLTADRLSLESAIREAQTRGGTALHEALYIALRELLRVQRLGQEIRRQALIVLSDGEDTSSRNVTLADVLETARRSAVTIFTVTPAASLEIDPFARIARNRASAEFDMRSIARETGGRSFAPARAEDLSSTYREIADELGQQYWLAYAAPASGGGYRRVSVTIVSRPELRARTRSGYIAASSRRVR
jgi:Ca-activated chloride channel family protein